MSSMSFANTDITTSSIEYSIVNYPGDKGKKNRRIKRKNKRRKRLCHKAARRNYAG